MRRPSPSTTPDAALSTSARPIAALARLLATASLAGCSLIVSGIDLPDDTHDAEVSVDAERDAAPDLGPDATPDATLDAEVDAAPDAAPDLGPDADLDATLDAEVDQAVDMLAPDAAVLPPRQLAGRWHLYGISGAEGVFEAALTINVLGAARLESINGEPLTDPVPLDGVAPAPFVAVGLGAYAERVEGILDPVSGAGVLVAGTAVAFASREQVPRPEDLIQAGYFAHAYYPPEPGTGVFGVLGVLPDSSAWVEGARQVDSGETPTQLNLTQETTAIRHILNSPDPLARRHLTPILDGRGALGITRRNQADWGIALLWNSQPVANLPPDGTWFCGGVVRENGGAVTRHRVARIEGESLVWAEGGRATLRLESGVAQVIAHSDPFFGQPAATAVPDASGRLFALFDRDPTTATVGWGFALCVRADWPPEMD